MQIMLALNVAYYALREIRTPAFTRFEVKAAKAKAECRQIRQILSSFGPSPAFPAPLEEMQFYLRQGGQEATVGMHEHNIAGLEDPYKENMAEWEGRLRYICLFAAALLFVLLIYATLHASHTFHARWVWVFVGLGFSPIAIFFWYNFVILKAMKITSGDLAAIHAEVSRLHDEVKTVDVPAYREIVRRRSQENTGA